MASNRKTDFDLSWAKALEQAQQQESSEPIGEGWMTAKEIFKKHNLGIVRGHRYLNDLMEVGKVERHIGARKNKQGKRVRCHWYRLVKK